MRCRTTPYPSGCRHGCAAGSTNSSTGEHGMATVQVYHAKRDATPELVVVQVEGRAPVPFEKHMTEVVLRTLRGPRRRELLRDLVTDRFVSCFRSEERRVGKGGRSRRW